MSRHLSWLAFILVLVVFSMWVVQPNTQGIVTDLNADGTPDINFVIRQSLGLDLVGGLRVLLQAELPPGSYNVDDLRETANNVGRRVNALGLTEATVQVQGTSRILVELPGVTDRDQAVSAIQQTALLEFVDFSGLGAQAQQLVGLRILTNQQLLLQEQSDALPEANLELTAEATFDVTAEATLEATLTLPTFEATLEVTPEVTAAVEATAEVTAAPTVIAEATTEPVQTTAVTEVPPTTQTPPAEAPRITNPLDGQPFTTVITGADLQSASAQYDPQFGWYIEFELTPEAGAAFGAFTGARIGQPLALVLDGEVLSAPTINSQLDTGGIIRGNFTEEEAKTLALQLRSGALPIPLRVESAQEVGATLGQEAVQLSIRAGIIGIIVVLCFMLIYYRVPGIAAALALLVFALLNLAVFKLIPVTLTLPAITGFLISIGTAVDGNILIFERMKEELRAGQSLDTALQAGFDRAWASIRDSNFSTIIICAILFLFGQTPGASIVSGFAVTLILGLLINLFTAVIVTRTFLNLLITAMRSPLERNAWLLGV